MKLTKPHRSRIELKRLSEITNNALELSELILQNSKRLLCESSAFVHDPGKNALTRFVSAHKIRATQDPTCSQNLRKKGDVALGNPEPALVFNL